MSWLRFSAVSAAVCVAMSSAAACGDTTTNNVTVVVPAEGGGLESGASDAPSAVADAGSDAASDVDVVDASTDASYDGPGCSNDQSSVSDTCNFGSDPCPSDVCSLTSSVVVYCQKHSGALDGGIRPPVDGCTYFGVVPGVGGAAQWCCPPACVPSSTNDTNCAADHRFMYCLHDTRDGGASFAAPVGCTQVTIDSPGEVQRGFCCPR